MQRLIIQDEAVRGVETDHGTLNAPIVVNCLGSWAELDGTFSFKLPVEPVRGQMLAFKGPRGLVRHAVMSERAYVVQRRDGRLVVGSTLERVGFDKALTLEGIHNILCGLRHLSSAFDACTFIDSWAGLRPLTTEDQLPIMGKTLIDGFYVATGHFRHGILLAPITASMMAQLILRGRAPFDLSPFDPRRFK